VTEWASAAVLALGAGIAWSCARFGGREEEADRVTTVVDEAAPSIRRSASISPE
jgi:hypothetical protein